MTTAKTLGMLLVVLAALAFSLRLLIRNYSECRASGLSRVYCTTTHLVR